MRLFIGAVVLALLSGCAAFGRDGDDQGAYFLMSKGEAGLIYQIFTGGVEYCKVTVVGMPESDYLLDFDYSEECKVTATVQSKE